MKKTGVIIPYFGKIPDWFPYFLNTSTFNENIHWFCFFDQSLPTASKSNVTFYHIQKHDFVDLVRKKLGFDIELKSSYKLCDFKPAFGKIFEDYLSGFDFWGYSDIDMVYGNINNFITEESLTKYDILSSYQGFLSGPFALFRNCNEVNNLFTHIRDFQELLSDPQHYGIDENNNTLSHNINWLNRCISLVTYIPWIVKSEMSTFTSMKELRYQYQWHSKKYSIKSTALLDMTEVIYYLRKQKKIKAHFREGIYSDRQFERKNINPWKVCWENGRLTEKYSNKQIMGFHFIDVKNDLAIPSDYQGDHVPFFLNGQGIYYD